MVSREYDPDGELRRRVARLEILMTLAFLRSGHDVDEDTRYLINQYLRDFSGRGAEYPSPDFDYLVERLAFRARQPSVEQVEERVAYLQSSQTELQQDLQEKTAALSNRLDATAEALGSLEREQRALSANTHEWLAVQSLGIDASNTRLSRFVPLRVYLSDTPNGAVEDLSRAIGSVLDAFGFEVADEFPPVRGSWFKKWFVKTTEVMTQPEVAERLEKLERALELKGLGQPQAEIDAKQAAAVAQLMKAVKDVPTAAIQAGSILLIKLPSRNGPIIQVRTLTQTELIHLENNQKLLASPADLLERLSDICQAGGYEPASIASSEKIDGKKQRKRTDGDGYVAEVRRPGGARRAGKSMGASGKAPKADDDSNISEGDLKQLPPPSANDRGTG